MTGHLPSWLEEQMLEKEAESFGMGHFEPAEEDREAARQDLGRWAGALPAIFKDQRPLVAVGHPSQEILRTILVEDHHPVGISSSLDLAKLLTAGD